MTRLLFDCSTGMMNPYHKFLDLPEAETRPDYYGLLGVPRFADDIQQIHAAAVTCGQKLRGWDNSKFYLEANAVLDEVAQASLLLEDPIRKAAYDAELRQRLGMPAATTVVETPSTTAAEEPERIVTPVAPQQNPRPERAVVPTKTPEPERATLDEEPHDAAADDSGTNADRLFLMLAGGLIAVTLLITVPLFLLSGHKSDPTQNPTVAMSTDSETPDSKTSSPTDEPVSSGIDMATKSPEMSPSEPPSDKPVLETTSVDTSPPPVAPDEITNSIGMKLRLIPAGEFLMGSSDADVAAYKVDSTIKNAQVANDQPQRSVILTTPFYMGQFEVTQSQYKRVMETNPSAFSRGGRYASKVPGNLDPSEFPVENVSWFDAVEFCNRLSEIENLSPYYTLVEISRGSDKSITSGSVSVTGSSGYRLPTEAEWEYACRAGTTKPFHFGDELNGNQANVDGRFPYGTTTKGPDLHRTTTVGSYAKNQNAFGLFDMHGNVMEWCFDAYDESAYAKRAEKTADPVVTSGSEHRILRGGSTSLPPAFAYSGFRFRGLPYGSFVDWGFRVVRGGRGGQPATKSAVPAESTPARIADRLKRRISVDFQRTPLQDAFTEIGDKIGTRFEIDGDALKQSGFTKNMAQTFKHDQQPASTVLADMLKQYGEMCLVVDDVKQKIVVTTLAIAKQQGLQPFDLTSASTASSSSPTPPPVPASVNELAKTYTSKSTNMKLVLIPAGEFTMGSPADEAGRPDNEGPQHQVRISQPFYMGMFEVTQSEYESVMGTNPSWHSKTGGGISQVSRQNTSRCPVERVSWNNAVEFCQKLSVKEGVTYRLPTEAEWEYAARAGTTTPFHFGSTLNGNMANVNGGLPYGTTKKGRYLGGPTVVGAYSKNDFGLFDMHGNVSEWCEDTFDEQAYASRSGTTTDPKVTSRPGARVLRGGSWKYGSRLTRSASRSWGTPGNGSLDVGFRVVISSAAVRTP